MNQAQEQATRLAEAYRTKGEAVPWWVEHAEQTGHTTSWSMYDGQRCLVCSDRAPFERLER